MKKMMETEAEEKGEMCMDDESKESHTMMTKSKVAMIDKNAPALFGPMAGEKKRPSIFVPTIPPGDKQGL
jgi:hypothetical protein